MFKTSEQIKNSLVKIETPIKDVVSRIDKEFIKIVFVLNNSNKLIATVNDGDVRRGILKGLSLEDTVEKFMHRQFKSVTEGTENSDIKKLMEKESINQIPEIDNEGLLLGVHLVDKFIIDKKEYIPNSVLLMAGGLGKRLMPLTSNCPKPMLKIAGKPMLEIILDQCIKSGIKSFYISVNYLKEQIIDYFGDGSQWGVDINYLEETSPLGTGGALKLIKQKLSHPLIVMNGDVITNLDVNKLLDFHQNNISDLTVCVRENKFISPFGVIEVDGNKLITIREKPIITQLVNAGIYLLNQSIIDLIGEQKAIDMPDLILKGVKQDLSIFTFPIYEYWLDIGQPQTLEQAKQDCYDLFLDNRTNH